MHSDTIRSQCPGKAFADSQVFLVAANLLKLFNIGPPANNLGLKSEDVKYRSGLIRYTSPCQCTKKDLNGQPSDPEPGFQCSISPRNAQVQELLRNAADSNL